MKRSITPSQIKENNRILIYQYLYKNRNRSISQQDISYELRLSRPTVTMNLTSLEADGLIVKSGQIDSKSVGRKAAAYSIVNDFRISIGVEVLKNELKMIAIDLYGEQLDYCVIRIPYHNEESYYQDVCRHILAFKDRLQATDKQILGISFAMQGLISVDGREITYGKILVPTGLTLDVFSRYLPYPCTFVHDATSAAVSEMWVSPWLKDAFYLSLSTHLGAAIISGGSILTGKHGNCSTIEHIKMVKHNGRLCYCGKHGCMETVCSLNTLLDGAEETDSIDDFFTQLRAGNSAFQERWTSYLKYLAEAINLLHLVYDTDFILGGYLAHCLREEDLQFLYQEIEKMTPFDEPRDFIRISNIQKHNIAIGAALPYIQSFLNDDAMFTEL